MSDMGLYCLPMYYKWETRPIRITKNFNIFYPIAYIEQLYTSHNFTQYLYLKDLYSTCMPTPQNDTFMHQILTLITEQ